MHDTSLSPSFTRVQRPGSAVCLNNRISSTETQTLVHSIDIRLFSTCGLDSSRAAGCRHPTDLTPNPVAVGPKRGIAIPGPSLSYHRLSTTTQRLSINTISSATPLQLASSTTTTPDTLLPPRHSAFPSTLPSKVLLETPDRTTTVPVTERCVRD
jgi:hypothetical protein